MNIIEAVGATCLGIVIGWIISYFLRRYQEFTPKTLGTTISLIAGGVVVKFLQVSPAVWWFYPIGLLIGLSAHTYLALRFGIPPEDVFFTEDVEEE
jgi:NhaP-type Na+/H+ or K+/H+ antiporter